MYAARYTSPVSDSKLTHVIQALIQSHLCSPTHFRQGKALFLSTHGILFCGVPHQGGNGVSEGRILLNAGSVFTHTTTKMVDILEPDNEVLKTQRDQYTAIADNFYTVALHETEKTTIGKVVGKLVGDLIVLVISSNHLTPRTDRSKRLCSHPWAIWSKIRPSNWP